MWGNVVGCELDQIYVEMPVEVTYEDLGEYTLPRFRPQVGKE